MSKSKKRTRHHKAKADQKVINKDSTPTKQQGKTIKEKQEYPFLVQNLFQVMRQELSEPVPNYVQILEKTLGFPMDIISSVLHKLAQEHPEQALLLCRETINHPNRQLVAVVAQALGGVRLPEAFEILNELEEKLETDGVKDAEEKELRKEVARARHRLRSFGVAPASTPENTGSPVKISAEREFQQALVSNVDGVGNILGVLVMRSPGGKNETAVLLFNDQTGLKDCRIYSFNQRQLDDFIKEWDLSTTGVRLVPTEREYLNYLVSEYLSQNRLSNWPIPQDFIFWRRYLEASEEYTQPPVYEKISLESIRESLALLLPPSEGLAQTPEMKNWLLEPAIVTEYAQKWLERQRSRIVVAGAFQMEFQQKLAGEMLERIFTPETMNHYHRRLEHMAWYFWITEQIGAARLALAAALDLKERQSPINSPLLRAIALSSLEAMATVLEAGPKSREETGE